MRYLWDNLIDNEAVTLSASSEDSEFPVENLQDQRIGKPWQTGATSALEDVVIDMGSAVAVDSFLCFAHDLIETDTYIKIQGNSSVDWGTPPVNETLTWVEGAIIKIFSETKTYRYWRFTFTKASAATTRSIGRIFLGPLFEAIGPIDKGYKVKTVDPSVVTESLPGQIYANTKTPYREWALNFDGFDQDEKDDYEEMGRAVGTHTAFFMQINPSVNGLDEWVNTFYKKVPEFDYQTTDGTDAIWKTDAEYREVV